MTLLDEPAAGFGAPDPWSETLAEAKAVLTKLGQLDHDEAGDDQLSESVLIHQHLRCLLDASDAKTLARWDARKCWRSSGAKTGAQWLAWKQRIPVQEARKRLRHARAVRELPAVGEAWAAGDVERTHVSALLGVRNARTAAAFADEHADLVDVARTRGFVDFKRRCDYWLHQADLDGVEQDATLARDGREVHLSSSIGGMWFGSMALDPISGEIVGATLSGIERELFEVDWAAAKERLGREPTLGELDRTAGQRRADALLEMATRARTAPAGGRRPAPLFTVLVGYETFAGPLCELANRSVVAPGQLVPHLTAADIERVVFDGPSRVTEVGAHRRFFTGADRRAIEVRDRTCFHPSCNEPPERPQIDHILEAHKGGPTVQANGRLGCAFHNRWRNTHPDHEWVEQDDDEGDELSEPDRPEGRWPRGKRHVLRRDPPEPDTGPDPPDL